MVLSWRRFRERVRAVLHLDESPERLAASMAVGVFIGTTPFYFFHTVLAVAVALVCRLNIAATVTGAWVNLPWFAPFVYAFSLKLGEAVLSGEPGQLWSLAELAAATEAFRQATAREHAGHFARLLWAAMFSASKPLLVGTTIFGAVTGAVAYLITLEAVREVRRLRRAHRKESVP